ncbi:hypothetical protein STENM223S_02615 [Streptomyces tendae]
MHLRRRREKHPAAAGKHTPSRTAAPLSGADTPPPQHTRRRRQGETRRHHGLPRRRGETRRRRGQSCRPGRHGWARRHPGIAGLRNTPRSGEPRQHSRLTSSPRALPFTLALALARESGAGRLPRGTADTRFTPETSGGTLGTAGTETDGATVAARPATGVRLPPAPHPPRQRPTAPTQWRPSARPAPATRSYARHCASTSPATASARPERRRSPSPPAPADADASGVPTAPEPDASGAAEVPGAAGTSGAEEPADGIREGPVSSDRSPPDAPAALIPATATPLRAQPATNAPSVARSDRPPNRRREARQSSRRRVRAPRAPDSRAATNAATARCSAVASTPSRTRAAASSASRRAVSSTAPSSETEAETVMPTACSARSGRSGRSARSERHSGCTRRRPARPPSLCRSPMSASVPARSCPARPACPACPALPGSVHRPSRPGTRGATRAAPPSTSGEPVPAPAHGYGPSARPVQPPVRQCRPV